MNVKLIASFLFGMCALPAALPAFGKSAQVTGVYYLKVRAAPNMEAPEAGVLEVGEVVEILDEVGPWAHVLFQNGRTGYASRKYLIAIGAGDAPATTTAVGPGDRGTVASPPSQPARAVIVPEPSRPTARTLEGVDTPQPRAVPAPLPSAVPTPQPRAVPTPQPSAAPTPRRPAASLPTQAARRPAPAQRPAPRPRPERSPGCTRKDLEALRTDLRALAAGQERLVALTAKVQRPNTNARQVSVLPPRDLVPWVGFGCVIGWIAARVFSLRRLRRHRIRI